MNDRSEDRDLLTALARGDMQALGELYDAYAPPVYHLLLARVGDQDKAQDLLQEVFLALVDRGRKAARIRNLPAYLLAIARRKASGVNKRRSPEVLSQTDLIDTNNCPAEGLAVRDALSQLPAEQREVVVLKVWHELTFAEVGQTLEISPNTAASRYRYAMEKLRDILGEMNDEL